MQLNVPIISALCLQELAAGKRLTSSQKAETLERLVADGWLAYMPAWPAITIGVSTYITCSGCSTVAQRAHVARRQGHPV